MEYNDGLFLQGDCLELMKTMPDESIDLVVTSPPYDNLRTYDHSLEWSFDIFKPIAKELSRLIKEGGVIIWNVSDATIKGSETGSSFRQALYFKDECGLNLHDTMIWVKDGGGAIGSNKCYTQNFEYMFVLSKGPPSKINLLYDQPNGSAGKNKSGVGRRDKDGNHKIEERKVSADFKKRNNWWYIPPQKGADHPAVFPISMPRDHILSWTNEGDVVLDPFGGSGTTAIAARETNRKWVLIEKNEEYFNKACKRISSHNILNV
jgi:site-specific DNA-methyltransferase (adenine-specific)